MASKLWQQQPGALHPQVEAFTIGQDPLFDARLAGWDVLGSMAHATMLGEVGLLNPEEATQLVEALKALHNKVLADGSLAIDSGVEDVHSQVELLLTEQLGEVGKRLHTARSRNDQVLLDINLFLRHELQELASLMQQLFNGLLAQAERHQNYLLPGYTHLQPAMPSSFGLWFGAYAEALADDLDVLQMAYSLANRNPLGSAAGYGSPFAINRARTTELLGFAEPHINVVKAQMSRGKTELRVAQLLAALGSTLSRWAMDVCLYASPNFGFLRLGQGFATGSSIMPHKQNPDVFELIRAEGNLLTALPGQIQALTTNLPSGYHRDYQLLKAVLFPALEKTKELLRIAQLAAQALEPQPDLLMDTKYDLLFTVEEVSKLVGQGVPFRDAYHRVAAAVKDGSFTASRQLQHSHLGSIGQPGFDETRAAFTHRLGQLPFQHVQQAISALLAS